MDWLAYVQANNHSHKFLFLRSLPIWANRALVTNMRLHDFFFLSFFFPLFLLNKLKISAAFWGCNISAVWFLYDNATIVLVVKHQSLFPTEKILVLKLDLAHHGQSSHGEWASKSSYCLCLLCRGLLSSEITFAHHFSVAPKTIYI